MGESNVWSGCFRNAMELLARDYNCAPADFTKAENTLTVSALLPGRRVYSPEAPFFQMATTGAGAVVAADARLHPFLRRWMRHRRGSWLFNLPNLPPLAAELERFGWRLAGTQHMFLPHRETAGDCPFPLRWYGPGEFERFYGDPRFVNALCPRFQRERPDRLAVCAMDGENIMGMAGISEDAPGWMQIGVDVLPACRSRGVGTALVTAMKNRVLAQGDTPFYGAAVANYHSWNIALNAGFRPAWVELSSEPVSKPYTAAR